MVLAKSKRLWNSRKILALITPSPACLTLLSYSHMSEKPPQSCDQLKAELQAIHDLTNEFDRAFEDSVKTGNLKEAKRLKAEIEEKTAALKEKLIPQEVRELHLELQYAEQVSVLEKAGLLEKLPSGEKGIVGIDGKPYPLPRMETVMARVREKKDLVKEKKLQGFEKLVLVPFGMSLDNLISTYGERLKAHHAAGKLGATNGDVLDLDADEPVHVWDKYPNADKDGRLVYDPAAFTKEGHGGKTKEAILKEQAERNDTARGWRVLLLEDLPDLPAKNQGKTVGNRPQLEADRTPNDYLGAIGQGDVYKHESGMTPEDWLAYALSELETQDRVIDDNEGQGKASYLTGAWFPEASNVPSAYWVRRVDRQANLGGDGAAYSYPDDASRSAVRI